MPQDTNRTERLQARVTPDAHAAAQRTVEQTQLIHLSVEDQRRFAEALINPPEPNEALRRAAKSHAEHVDVR